MYILLAIVGLVATALAKDVTVGDQGGRLIFEQNVTASPAIWRQEKNITVNASDFETITQVVIVDNREDKNGEAAVVEGGEGHKNVTIELKSPAVFRGFDFLVRVYAKNEDGIQRPVNNDQQNVQNPVVQDTTNDKQVPKDDVMKGSVTQVPSTAATQVTISQDDTQHPAVVGRDDQQLRPNRDTQGQDEQKPLIPTSNGKDVHSDEAQVQHTNPMNDADWDSVLDNIFSEDSSSEETGTALPTQVTNTSNDTEKSLFNVNRDGKDVTIEDVPSATEKILIDQQGQKSLDIEDTDSQQFTVKPLKGVPLPYVKH